MRIGLFSDLHFGITQASVIKSILEALKEEKPDILVNCGDDCGSYNGHEGIASSAKLCREIFGPYIPIISVLGNHDYWSGHGGKNWSKNKRLIREAHEKYGIENLDTIGACFFGDVCFFGNSGWYTNPYPPTNDKNFLPKTFRKEDINKYLIRTKTEQVRGILNRLPIKDYTKYVFVSHFPIISAGPDYKGRFEDFSWDDSELRQLLIDAGVNYFLCGHAHQWHQGPLRFEAGSDYYRPAYQIVEV